MGFIANTFHERYGKGSGSNSIGDGTPGNGTHQTAGHHGRLGGTAAHVSRQGKGQVNKEPSHPGLFKESTEENEEKDIGRGNTQGRAENSFRGQVGLIDDPFQVISLVGKEPGI